MCTRSFYCSSPIGGKVPEYCWAPSTLELLRTWVSDTWLDFVTLENVELFLFFYGATPCLFLLFSLISYIRNNVDSE